MPKVKLSKSMAMTDFENGYWYATELKAFAGDIGIPGANRLRKDELEKAIKLFMTTGELKRPTSTTLSPSGPRDIERGLRPSLPVRLYINDKATKAFLEREAQKLAPGLKRRSGVRYRLNRWREEQLAKGIRLTYGDLVKEYVRLNQLSTPFDRILHGRYINFISDFFASEKDSTRQQAIRAWEELKTMDVKKDYRSWIQARSRR